jgi:hypothetical protein
VAAGIMGGLQGGPAAVEEAGGIGGVKNKEGTKD